MKKNLSIYCKDVSISTNGNCEIICNTTDPDDNCIIEYVQDNFSIGDIFSSDEVLSFVVSNHTISEIYPYYIDDLIDVMLKNINQYYSVDEILDNISESEIESYLRKKKIARII
jgi:hypothetical protein